MLSTYWNQCDKKTHTLVELQGALGKSTVLSLGLTITEEVLFNLLPSNQSILTLHTVNSACEYGLISASKYVPALRIHKEAHEHLGVSAECPSFHFLPFSVSIFLPIRCKKHLVYSPSSRKATLHYLRTGLHQHFEPN